MPKPALSIVGAGMFSTIQDLGRYGYRRFGVSLSGAVDPLSMAIANALVGNAAGEAAVEMTLTGGEFLVEAEHCRIAVAGAELAFRINGAAAIYRAHDLVGGDRLRFATARAGMRAYLAVAGGFDIAPVLGSCSTHVRSRMGGIEGRKLAAGDRLPLRSEARPDTPALALPAAHRPEFGGAIHVMLGPQADAFTEAGLQTFLSGAYQISIKADRMGCQLDGPPVQHKDGFNIISDGIVPGSVQVPGHGRPIVLLADCQTTGGYPKIATVIAADLRKIGQRRPGDRIDFAVVDEAEALRRAVAERRILEEITTRFLPASDAARRPTTSDLLSRNLVSGVVCGRTGSLPGPDDRDGASLLPKDAKMSRDHNWR